MKGVNVIQNFKMKQLRLSESSRNRKDSRLKILECSVRKTIKNLQEMGSINE